MLRECGGDFQHTPGVTLINLALSPQPTSGKAYSGTVSDRGRPLAYGSQTVCAYLEDSTVGRVYANDESLTVNVTPQCTAAGRRYDAAAKALARARRQYRHAHGRQGAPPRSAAGQAAQADAGRRPPPRSRRLRARRAAMRRRLAIATALLAASLGASGWSSRRSPRRRHRSAMCS